LREELFINTVRVALTLSVTEHWTLVKVKAELSPTLSLHIDGGLSDNNERKGKEWEAVINSPPKGKT
jgi:hypothetical protein